MNFPESGKSGRSFLFRLRRINQRPASFRTASAPPRSGKRRGKRPLENWRSLEGPEEVKEKNTKIYGRKLTVQAY